MSHHVMIRRTCGQVTLWGLAAIFTIGCFVEIREREPVSGPTPTPRPTPTPIPTPMPPPDAAPAPVPDAAPLPIAFAPQDGFDATRNLWLYLDQGEQALMGTDMETGLDQVVYENWPWPKENMSLFEFALGEGGDDVYVFVSHSYLDPNGDGGHCNDLEMLRVGVERQTLEILRRLDGSCCDDCDSNDGHNEPFIDSMRGVLRYVHDSCDPNYCDTYLAGYELDSLAPIAQHYLYTDYCEEPDEWCESLPLLLSSYPRDISVDPRAPAERVLMLMNDFSLISMNHESGEFSTVTTIRAQWGGVRLLKPRALSFDINGKRAFATMTMVDSYRAAVIEVDLATGAQRLVYAGEPAEGGGNIDCGVDVAFDAERSRLLYRSLYSSDVCSDGIYGLDVETGVATRLFVDSAVGTE